MQFLALHYELSGSPEEYRAALWSDKQSTRIKLLNKQSNAHVTFLKLLVSHTSKNGAHLLGERRVTTFSFSNTFSVAL